MYSFTSLLFYSAYISYITYSNSFPKGGLRNNPLIKLETNNSLHNIYIK